MLRKFKEIDIRSAADMIVRVFAAPPFNYDKLDREHMKRYVGDMYKTPGFLSFCLEEEGRAVGYCLGIINDYFEELFYEIRELYIDPDFQGGGRGSGFLSAVELHLEVIGIKLVTLNTSRKIRAYGFYEQNGFKLVEAAAHMSKRLS